ncbi:MAG: hypothetical protein AAGC55_31535, partial [Myxococcota bacterium]
DFLVERGYRLEWHARNAILGVKPASRDPDERVADIANELVERLTDHPVAHPDLAIAVRACTGQAPTQRDCRSANAPSHSLLDPRTWPASTVVGSSR